MMSDAWEDAGLPKRRGRSDAEPPRADVNASVAVARQIVDDINEDAVPHESTFGNGLKALISERGLTVVEDISLERQENEYVSVFSGFLLVLANDVDTWPFAAIRLRNERDQEAGRSQYYAELWRPDRR